MPPSSFTSCIRKRKSPDENASSHGGNRAKKRKVEQLVNGFFAQQPSISKEQGSGLCRLPCCLGSHLYTYFALHAGDPIEEGQTEFLGRNNDSKYLSDPTQERRENGGTSKPIQQIHRRPQKLKLTKPKLTMCVEEGRRGSEGSSANSSIVDLVSSPSMEQDTREASEVESLPDDPHQDPSTSAVQLGQQFIYPASTPLSPKSSGHDDARSLNPDRSPPESLSSAPMTRSRPRYLPKSWDETHPAGT